MRLPIMLDHLKDDAVEQYAIKHLASANLESVELHLMACPACQIRLAECDKFVAATRAAFRHLQVKKTGLPAHSDDVDQSIRFDADQIGAKRRKALSV